MRDQVRAHAQGLQGRQEALSASEEGCFENLWAPVDHWLTFLQLERGLSKGTVLSYRSDLNQAVSFLAQTLVREGFLSDPLDVKKNFGHARVGGDVREQGNTLGTKATLQVGSSIHMRSSIQVGSSKETGNLKKIANDPSLATLEKFKKSPSANESSSAGGRDPDPRSVHRDSDPFLAEQLHPIPVSGWSRIRPEDLMQWAHHLTECGYTPRSLSRKLTAMRGLVRFLAQTGVTGQDLSHHLALPRWGRPLPETLPPQVTSQLLDAPWDQNPLGYRDHALLELLYGSGLRVSELVHLRFNQVDMKAAWVRIWGKGQKERLVPLGRSACAALQIYCDQGRPALVRPGSPGYLFLNRRGGPLSRKGIWERVRHRGRQVGLADRLYPHLLRHAFATDLLAGGANLRAIQEMLGHAHVSTTQIYTHVDKTQLLQAHAQFHPSWDPAAAAPGAGEALGSGTPDP